nr:MAG TPA: hypothetical protein [Caudoviricetes sp.]
MLKICSGFTLSNYRRLLITLNSLEHLSINWIALKYPFLTFSTKC